jgi:hypothetical protein
MSLREGVRCILAFTIIILVYNLARCCRKSNTPFKKKLNIIGKDETLNSF